MRKSLTKTNHTNETTANLLKQPYARVLVPEDDGTYSADILEFPGCHAEGDTPDEAVSSLEAAAASWIEAAIEQGQTIPPPSVAHGYSGNINLRLPKSIHKQAARFAEIDKVSLNQFFTSAIAARVGAEMLFEHLARRLEDGLLFRPVRILSIQQSATNYFLCGMSGAEMTAQSASSAASQLASEDFPRTFAIPQQLSKVSTNG